MVAKIKDIPRDGREESGERSDYRKCQREQERERGGAKTEEIKTDLESINLILKLQGYIEVHRPEKE